MLCINMIYRYCFKPKFLNNVGYIFFYLIKTSFTYPTNFTIRLYDQINCSFDYKLCFVGSMVEWLECLNCN